VRRGPALCECASSSAPPGANAGSSAGPGTVAAMRSWRLLLTAVAVNEIPVEADYADLFVVLREGEDRPGPNDWEATVRTPIRQRVPPGTYELRGETPDGLTLSGHAVVRFSDGHQHHFRGDGLLGGVEQAIT